MMDRATMLLVGVILLGSACGGPVAEPSTDQADVPDLDLYEQPVPMSRIQPTVPGQHQISSIVNSTCLMADGRRTSDRPLAHPVLRERWRRSLLRACSVSRARVMSLRAET